MADQFRIAEENKLRDKFGLQPLNSQLKLYRDEFDAQDWKNDRGDLSKRIQRNAARDLIWEEDYYYSGKNVVLDREVNSGSVAEQLTVHYDYKTHELTFGYVGMNGAYKELIRSASSTKGIPEKLRALRSMVDGLQAERRATR